MLDLHVSVRVILSCGGALILTILTGCAWWRTTLPPPTPPLTILVGPVTLDVHISSSSQIHTFDSPPAPETEPALRAQLLDEVQQRAQALLIEQLGRQPGFRVIPFEETRRLMADLAPAATDLTPAQRQALAQATGAQVIVTGKILTYGAIRWKHVLVGWALQETAEFLAVGFGSGFNVVALGAWAGVSVIDAVVIDLPMWVGGGYLLGWAFRPVQTEVEAVQIDACEGTIWSNEATAVTIPRKTLASYPEAMRRRKEVQLTVNLELTLTDLAETAGRTLRLHPCTEAGTVAIGFGERLRSLVGLGP